MSSLPCPPASLPGREFVQGFAGTAAGAEGLLDVEGSRRLAGPVVGAEGAVAVERQANAGQLGFGHGAVDDGSPVWRPVHGPGTERRRLLLQAGVAGAVLGQARPRPVLGPADEFGAEGVGFDVAAQGQEVVVVLDAEVFVAALVEVAGGAAVVAVVSAGVGEGEPLHEALQVAVGAGAQDEVPVVAHQAPAQQVDVEPREGVGEDVEEGLEVFVLAEDCLAAVAAVQDVVDQAGLDAAAGAGHRRSVTADGEAVNMGRDPFMSFFLSVVFIDVNHGLLIC